MSEFVFWLNRLPNETWDKWLSGVLGAYDASKDHDPLSLVFWWRELWHLSGGILLGIALCWLPMAPVTAPLAIWGLMQFKEIVNDLIDQKGILDFKNFVDPAVFALGAFIINLLIEMVK